MSYLSTKICSKCEIEKSLDEFYLSSTNKRDGRQYICKTCQTEYQKSNNFKQSMIKYQKTSKRKESVKKYRKNNINARLAHNLRSRISGCIKSGSAVIDLGCSVEFLKEYMASKFQEGMTWENYGREGWHIDHILPLAKFDLSDRKQLLEVCHYTNLQPLWAIDNIRKSDN